MSTSTVYVPLRARPAPKSFILGETRIRRIKCSFLVLALLVAPALGLTTAEVAAMIISPGESKPRTHRMSLRELEAALRPNGVHSAPSAADSDR